MDNIGTLLGHNIWQSIIVFTLVFVVFKLIKDTSAEERSWSWSATLFVIALLPMAAFLPGEGIKLERSAEVAPVEKIASMELPKLLTAPTITKENIVAAQSGALNIFEKKDIVSAFLLIWAFGSAFALYRLGRAGFNASQLRRSAYPFASSPWTEEVEIAVSDHINGPIVIGLFKPLILIPRDFAFGMERAELEPLLYHELAHIKRRDNMLHFIERLVLAFYWWNPVMHFIATRIAEERELACDDRAAKKCGDNLIYAKSLLKGAQKLVGEKKPILGLAVLRRESVLSKRVKRLTVSSAFTGLNIGRLAKNLSAIFMAMLLLGLVTPRIAIGQEEQEEQDVQVMTDQEREEFEADIRASLEDMLSKEEIAKIRADAIASMPSNDELARIREEALAQMLSEEEIASIRKEALASVPTVEELKKIQQEAMASMLSAQELQEIRKQALESVPSMEELAKIREDAMANVPSVEELARIREEAIKNIPSTEELERIREKAITNMPTEEDFERMREELREKLENMPSEAELEQIRKDVRESMKHVMIQEKKVEELRATITDSIAEVQDDVEN